MSADMDPNQMIPRSAYRLLAGEAEHLLAERDRLRQALLRLANPHPSWAMPDVRNIANQALRGPDA